MKTLPLLFMLLSLTVCLSQIPVIKLPKLSRSDQAIRLFLCSLNGKDKGVRKAFRQVVMGLKSQVHIENCLLGCHLGWVTAGTFLHSYFTGQDRIGNYFTFFDTRGNGIQNLAIEELEKLYKILQTCSIETMEERNKCEFGKEVSKCVTAHHFPAAAILAEVMKPFVLHKLDMLAIREDTKLWSKKLDRTARKLINRIFNK